MARAIGFHRHGDEVDYALIEHTPQGPPEVLAAGRCAIEQVREIYLRLSAEQFLPWALAEERGGKRVPGPGPEWPLQRPAARGMLHPAVAAGIWEWDNGRIQDEDLFLWLRPARLLWSRGEPGRGLAGSEARTGPLAESLDRILARTGGRAQPIALVVTGDAPGATTLTKALDRIGCRYRPLKGLPNEKGADRAAAGAAVGALGIARPGVHPPARLRSREPWLWAASFCAAVLVGGAIWLSRADRAAEPAQSAAARLVDEEVQLPPIPVPEGLARLLDRRRAAVRALESLLEAAPAGALQELEIVTAAGSPDANVRLRLTAGAAGEAAGAQDTSAPAAVDWRSELPPGFELEAEDLRDGSLLVRGRVRPAP